MQGAGHADSHGLGRFDLRRLPGAIAPGAGQADRPEGFVGDAERDDRHRVQAQPRRGRAVGLRQADVAEGAGCAGHRPRFSEITGQARDQPGRSLLVVVTDDLGGNARQRLLLVGTEDSLFGGPGPRDGHQRAVPITQEEEDIVGVQALAHPSTHVVEDLVHVQTLADPHPGPPGDLPEPVAVLLDSAQAVAFVGQLVHRLGHRPGLAGPRVVAEARVDLPGRRLLVSSKCSRACRWRSGTRSRRPHPGRPPDASAAAVPSRSLLVRPSRSPASTSACLTQSRTAVSVRSKSLAT